MLACALAISATAPIPVAQAADNSRQSIQQQDQKRLDELRRRNLLDPPQSERGKANTPRNEAADLERASLLYRNLTAEQKMTHEQALQVLERAGYPTHGIKPRR